MTLSDVSAEIKDFIQRQTKLSLIISGILIFFVLSAVIIALAYASHGTKKRIQAPYDSTFVAVDEFLAPNAPSIVQDYYYSRQTRGEGNDSAITMPAKPVRQFGKKALE